MIFAYRKTIPLTILLFAAKSVIGGSMGMVQTYDGIYIGADIGVSSLIDSTSTTNPLDAHHMSATGIVGGGLIGYDYSINERMKLGIEGFAQANGLNASSTEAYVPFASYRVSSRYNVGARILPGYQFNIGTIGHVILGYTNAEFKIKDNGDYGFINQSFNKSGFQCGLGMKADITRKLSIRGDAIYSLYANATNNGVSVSPFTGQQVYHNNFSTLEGDLALVYKF